MEYISIFFLSFLAATIIPFSSEVGLLSYMAVGKFNNELLLIFASLGNILGSCVNYILGLYIIKFKTKSWFPFKDNQILKATKWFNRFGVYSLFFAFLPIVGDPLTLIAGMFRVSFIKFIILVSFGKILRYLLIYYGVSFF
jgi:membrane protein YqaA with SNARE-associated domain